MLKNRHYRQFGLLGFVLVCSLSASAIVLHNSLIRWLDGVPGVLGEKEIKNMIHIFGKLRTLRYGKKDPASGKFQGNFEVEGQLYSVHELARSEHLIDQEFDQMKHEIYKQHIDMSRFEATWQTDKKYLETIYCQRRQEEEEKIIKTYRSSAKKGEDDDDATLSLELGKVGRINQLDLTQALKSKKNEVLFMHAHDKKALEIALIELEEARQKKLARYQPALRRAKDEFIAINEPYLASAKGAKAIMEKLIEESCQLRNRGDSFLLDWARVPEGEEMKSFDRNTTTLRALDTACADLANFLTDVISSCPKACAQAGLTIPK